MADRTLVAVADQRDPRWRLRVERSAAGKPGGIVVMEFEGEERGSVLVADLLDLARAISVWIEVSPADLDNRTLVEAHDAATIRADHLMHEIRRRVRTR